MNSAYLYHMPKPDKYIPIDCNFYDRFEAAIVLRKTVRLEYRNDDGEEHTVETRLKDTLTKGGEEFLILPSGETIRMDRIISLDGEVVPRSC